MAAINDLIKQIKDPELQLRIQKEVDKLAKQKKFGLVFEEHLPECTPLYDIPVKPGCNVMLRDSSENKSVYKLIRISDRTATCVNKNNNEDVAEFSVNDIVRVAEFGEPIYPYLKPIDSVCNAPDSDLWHTLIEADNYHALQLLEYLYAGKVDCIYIDPPYNTGARDWKYNNNYVDNNDQFRHSKWLSFMEKRLRIAKRLLNPSHGIIMIAIDDNELNTLGLLLDEVFNGYKKFCVTVIHNPNGNQGKNFGITNEFVYFVLPTGDQLLSLENREDDPDIRPLRDVSGNSNLRTDARNCFYPIFIKDETIVGFGDVCEDNFHPQSANEIQEDGTIAVYPIDASGIEKKWVFARNTVEGIIDELHVEWNNSRKIWDIIRYKTHFTYKSVWGKKAYNANSYGSKLINKILCEKRFDYPKSIYAVLECIRAACGTRRDALVVDFFSGSGTTMHAVNLLNYSDGGCRRCIMVTNNEVSETEAKVLSKKGFHPGDDEWEQCGIARNVTWPRTVCSIKGRDVKGRPLEGEYGSSHDAYIPDAKGKGVYKKVSVPDDSSIIDLKMCNGFKANAVFFKLGFLDKTKVALGMQFKEMLAMLWMKAGAIGRCPKLTSNALPDMLVLPENRFAVLINENEFASFKDQVSQHKEIQTAFLITDYDVNYRSMVKSLAIDTTYQLYRDYLDNFRINYGRN